MKKLNGSFLLSATDIAKIESHTRAMARKACYDGSVEAWFDHESGKTYYYEMVGQSYMRFDNDDMECIYVAHTNRY